MWMTAEADIVVTCGERIGQTQVKGRSKVAESASDLRNYRLRHSSATEATTLEVPQGVGEVRNVGLDLRRWQSAARVRVQSLLSGSLPARSLLLPGQVSAAWRFRCQRYADTQRGTVMSLQKHPRSSDA